MALSVAAYLSVLAYAIHYRIIWVSLKLGVGWDCGATLVLTQALTLIPSM